jgi:hypothetical protein
VNQHVHPEPAVHLDLSGTALVVLAVHLTDEAVVREARHWTTGRRGPAVNDVGAEADLSVFLTEAVALGSRALAAMGQSGEARAVEAMLREVGEKTSSATGRRRSALGGGSLNSPRRGLGSSRVRDGYPVVRSLSCSAACCCRRVRASAPMPDDFSSSGAAVARSRRVATPTARSASRWWPRMPATRPRSSACRSSVVHFSAQRHC